VNQILKYCDILNVVAGFLKYGKPNHVQYKQYVETRPSSLKDFLTCIFKNIRIIMELCTNNDRPRERLKQLGVSALSDEELLQILIGSGTRKNPVASLARELLKVLDNRNGKLTVQDLEAVSGIGTAKAGSIVAALEFARRRIRPEGIRISSAEDVLPLIQHYSHRKQEHFLTLSLNGAHEVLHTRCITIGLLNSSQVHPREVFTDPIQDRAAAIILAHNHPSGNTRPSEADIHVTKTLVQAGKILGIRVLDHIIISHRGSFFSMREERFVEFE
jgi:DNA repair protein RadC